MRLRRAMLAVSAWCWTGEMNPCPHDGAYCRRKTWVLGRPERLESRDLLRKASRRNLPPVFPVDQTQRVRSTQRCNAAGMVQPEGQCQHPTRVPSKQG